MAAKKPKLQCSSQGLFASCVSSLMFTFKASTAANHAGSSSLTWAFAPSCWIVTLCLLSRHDAGNFTTTVGETSSVNTSHHLSLFTVSFAQTGDPFLLFCCPLVCTNMSNGPNADFAVPHGAVNHLRPCLCTQKHCLRDVPLAPTSSSWWLLS